MKGKKDAITIRISITHWICYIVLWFAFWLLYRFLKSHFLMMLLVIMVLLPIVSMVSAGRMARRLSLDIIPVRQRVQNGQEGIWRIRLQNDSYGLSLLCTLFGTVENAFLQMKGDLEVEMPISMKYTETMDLPLKIQYPGLARVQIQRMEYQDPMGLLLVRVPLTAAGECVVLPGQQEGGTDRREGYQAGITEAEETLAKGNDFSEVTDMREYRPGDRIKDIHWKLSAKKQDLMVKERASVAQSQVILLLDLSGAADMVTRVLELSYGVSREFLQEAVPVRILWWDPVRSDFEEVLIAEMDALEDGFGEFMHGRICRVEQNLPELLHRVRPMLQSCVYFHGKQGLAEGEVISHV